MNFFEKNLKDLEYKDISKLLENKIPESTTIEYKGLGYLDKHLNPNFDNNRWDFVKKVCSFANTSGGYIIFGIKAENNIPIEINGCGIQNFIGEIEKLIIPGIQPLCNYDWQPIENPHDSKRPIYVLYIYESNSPAMISFKNHPQRGTFSIRINDNTDIADRNLVELLFNKKEKGRRVDKSAQTIYKEFKEIIVESRNNIKINRFNLLIKRYEDIFAELGIITKKNIIVVLSKYEFLPNGLIIDFTKQNEKTSSEDPNIINEFFSDLRDYWRKELFINIIE